MLKHCKLKDIISTFKWKRKDKKQNWEQQGRKKIVQESIESNSRLSGIIYNIVETKENYPIISLLTAKVQSETGWLTKHKWSTKSSSLKKRGRGDSIWWGSKNRKKKRPTTVCLFLIISKVATL